MVLLRIDLRWPRMDEESKSGSGLLPLIAAGLPSFPLPQGLERGPCMVARTPGP
ncbi:hypothetical protein IscW_ISCW020230 [Ixodes scapularis]|uniref:Uncharacterized protein n=1 Tax=Ixodes scapularis TaxID=6945 RepID=B7Q1M3_IXOSC|nr:hypothetical protein IscW_ISCW020230 [Ixodes scapularis]|eukprot:XP_002409837.1 hypothetical protein IscW_ISCW020230 [Ixodes scapularis]